MSKTVVTDEMVDRGRAYYYGPHAATTEFAVSAQRETIRKILEAAINPPAEPEIPVSEAMIAAAVDARMTGAGIDCPIWIAGIYRAMEKERRKAENLGCPGTPHFHMRHGDASSIDHHHRRTGDK